MMHFQLFPLIQSIHSSLLQPQSKGKSKEYAVRPRSTIGQRNGGLGLPMLSRVNGIKSGCSSCGRK